MKTCPACGYENYDAMAAGQQGKNVARGSSLARDLLAG